MVGVADVGMGSAGEAAAVAGDQQLALGLGGAAHGLGSPYRSALAVIDDAGELGVAGQFLQHRLGQPRTVGKLRDELAGGFIDMGDHADVSEGLSPVAVGAAGGEALQGVGHALVEAAALVPAAVGGGLLLVGVMHAAGLGPQPVADAVPGHHVELSTQVHHPVVTVVHTHTASGPLAGMLALAAVALAIHSPAAGLFRELLGPHRLSLGQQLAVRIHIGRASPINRLGQPLGVGLRHPPLSHRVAQPRHVLGRLGSLDLAASLLPRQPRA